MSSIKKKQERLTKKQRIAAGRIVLVAILIAYACIVYVFKENRLWAGLGSGLVVLVLVFCAWRFEVFRQFLWSTSKTGFSLVAESLTAVEKEKRVPILAAKQKSVRERAGYTCQIPGCSEFETPGKNRHYLEIHHINEKNSDNRLGNLILLCPNHHTKVHDRGKSDYTPKDLRRLNRASAKKRA